MWKWSLPLGDWSHEFPASPVLRFGVLSFLGHVNLFVLFSRKQEAGHAFMLPVCRTPRLAGPPFCYLHLPGTVRSWTSGSLHAVPPMLLTRKKENLTFPPTLCEISAHLLLCRLKERNICSVLHLLPSSHAGRLQELEKAKTRQSLLRNGSRHRESCKHSLDYNESAECNLWKLISPLLH